MKSALAIGAALAILAASLGVGEATTEKPARKAAAVQRAKNMTELLVKELKTPALPGAPAPPAPAPAPPGPGPDGPPDAPPDNPPIPTAPVEPALPPIAGGGDPPPVYGGCPN